VRVCMCEEGEEEEEGRRKEEKFHNYDNYITNNESSILWILISMLWDWCERFMYLRTCVRRHISLLDDCIKPDLTIASSESLLTGHICYLYYTVTFWLYPFIFQYMYAHACLCFTAVCKFPSWSSSNVPRCFFLVPRPTSLVPWRM